VNVSQLKLRSEKFDSDDNDGDDDDNDDDDDNNNNNTLLSLLHSRVAGSQRSGSLTDRAISFCQTYSNNT
jgi:hypothetical protein